MTSADPVDDIQRATIDDVSHLRELLTILFAQEADFGPDHEKQERGLKLIIESPHVGVIFVGRDGAAITGMVSLLFSVSTAEGGPVCWLEDLIVHPDHRGKGIGSRLLQSAIEWARAKHFLRISLLTDRLNAGAIHFYERHGFTHSAMTPLRLRLPQPD